MGRQRKRVVTGEAAPLQRKEENPAALHRKEKKKKVDMGKVFINISIGLCIFSLVWFFYALYMRSALAKQDLIRYGKTKQQLKRDNWLRVFDIPKRWFCHFYVVSVGWNGVLVALSLNVLLQNHPFPLWLTDILGFLNGVPRAYNQVPQVCTLLVQLLLCIHSLRRLLECLLVSVFSEGAIHLVQYLFGLGYYIILGLTVLCPDHLDVGDETPGALLSQLDWFHVAGTVLFTWASLLQHRSLVLLARLRKGDSGAVETLAHRVPDGGWFDLVSCPHYFAELLIYVSLSLVSGGQSLTLWCVVLYVLFNQALAAQLCHEYYISKFDSYPRHRKAFIPFVL